MWYSELSPHPVRLNVGMEVLYFDAIDVFSVDLQNSVKFYQHICIILASGEEMWAVAI